MNKQKCIFLDRDGVINVDFVDYVYDVEKFEFIDGVPEALKAFKDAGYLIIVITNQSGIVKGIYTLDDVMNWLGGCYGRELLDKIKTREWCLCDLNRYPKLPLDVEKHGNKTLQYLGLFPSGKMGVRLSEDSWKDGDDAVGLDVHGSARGLGAASRLMLH